MDELLAADFGDWQPLLQRWRQSPAGQAVVQAVDARVSAGATVYPAEPFRALALTPLSAVKVVILGQDPYHGPSQAEGLAFSVPAGQKPPPSLRNIFKELHRDLGLGVPAQPSLQPWAQRGVLLLNTSLTVEDGEAASHSKLGWQALTDAICVAVAVDPTPKVFMLWGGHAQALAPRLSGTPHLVLCSNHPSPLSALRPPVPFIGNGHFGLANAFLRAADRPPINWDLASAQPVL
ncbi:uracil-DNA glycosylase [beta proteobacterium AAP121]|nr:uracil-DNA glycosylase [beta proteobacterium AAP65]KPF97393.1 uracil-DNA glycosylase [beta proteobacterium AAP121]